MSAYDRPRAGLLRARWGCIDGTGITVLCVTADGQQTAWHSGDTLATCDWEGHRGPGRRTTRPRIADDRACVTIIRDVARDNGCAAQRAKTDRQIAPRASPGSARWPVIGLGIESGLSTAPRGEIHSREGLPAPRPPACGRSTPVGGNRSGTRPNGSPMPSPRRGGRVRRGFAVSEGDPRRRCHTPVRSPSTTPRATSWIPVWWSRAYRRSRSNPSCTLIPSRPAR